MQSQMCQRSQTNAEAEAEAGSAEALATSHGGAAGSHHPLVLRVLHREGGAWPQQHACAAKTWNEHLGCEHQHRDGQTRGGDGAHQSWKTCGFGSSNGYHCGCHCADGGVAEMSSNDTSQNRDVADRK